MNPTQAEAMEALDVLDKLPGYQTAKDTLRAYMQASGEPVDYHWRSRIKGGAWDAWERGRAPKDTPPFMEIEERPLYAHHQPAPVSDGVMISREIPKCAAIGERG